MTDTLLHRGPDEAGFFIEPDVELGMRRLAIIDVAHGHQPASDESGDIQVILNGEIYNFQDLRHRLEALGHTFVSASDTEVIAHAYEQWGQAAITNLNGMFALAIWDRRTRELVLARDRAGKKPLLYATTPSGGIVFASEARAILRSGWQPQPDFQSLNHVLAFGYVPTDQTAFAGIHSLPPAHTLVWREGQVRHERYWSLDWRSPASMTVDEAVDGAEDLIRSAVRRRLVSERPLGVFLSGGIDSTVVTAIASELQSRQVSTFTVSFGDPQFNEAHYAEKIAAVLGTDHHTIRVDPDPHFVETRLPAIFDQPFADSSAVPTSLLAQFASEEIVVALGGDGGDEAFVGYDRYLAAPSLQRWNLLISAAQPLRHVLRRAATIVKSRQLQRGVRALRGYPSLADRYMALMTLTLESERRQLWSSELALHGSIDTPERHFKRLWEEVPVESDVDRMVAVDFATYLPGDLLVKADISTMASSLELRSPLLDMHVLEFAASIPQSIRTHQGTPKFILKEIARRYVPRELIDRPKMGFGIPRARWLREDLRDMVHDTLLGPTSTQRGWFDQATLKSLVKQHDGGLDRDSVLWPLLMIELWARAWID